MAIQISGVLSNRNNEGYVRRIENFFGTGLDHKFTLLSWAKQTSVGMAAGWAAPHYSMAIGKYHSVTSSITQTQYTSKVDISSSPDGIVTGFHRRDGTVDDEWDIGDVINPYLDAWILTAVRGEHDVPSHSGLNVNQAGQIVANNPSMTGAAFLPMDDPLTDLILYANPPHLATHNGLQLAGFAVFNRHLSDSEVQDIGLKNNADAPEHSTGLMGYWQGFDDWGLNSDIIPDLSINGNDIVAPANWVWIDDNPTSPIIADNVEPLGRGHRITFLTTADAPIYVGQYDTTAPTPSAEDIKAGTGVGFLQLNTVTPVGGVGVVEMSGGTTWTQYDYHAVLDLGANLLVESSEAMLDVTTKGMVTPDLGDIAGSVRADLANINWAWFDETVGTTLQAPIDSGVVSADSNGTIICDLTNSELNQGNTGRLDLDCVDGEETYTASYFLEVE